MAQLSAISSELESVATRSALDSLRKALAEGGGANGRGSGSGRLNRLFDQLHEPRPVVGEAAHVARGWELDGRRSSALGHEPLQGRVDGAVVARNCVPRREYVPGGGAGWSAEEAQARGALLGCDLGAQLRIQVQGEVLGEELRVDDDEGERRGEHQMCQKRPRRVANAQATDRLT